MSGRYARHWSQMKEVRFTKPSRHDEWGRRETATIVRVLAEPNPPDQEGIYILKLGDGREVWATDSEIEAWDQLSLF